MLLRRSMNTTSRRRPKWHTRSALGCRPRRTWPTHAAAGWRCSPGSATAVKPDIEVQLELPTMLALPAVIPSALQFHYSWCASFVAADQRL